MVVKRCEEASISTTSSKQKRRLKDVIKQSHRTGEYKSVSLSIERKEYVWNPKVPLKVDIFAWEVVWGKYLEVGPAHKWGRELLNK